MVTAANRLSEALRNWGDWDCITPLAAAPRLGPVLSEGSGHLLFELLDAPSLVARVRRRPTSEVEGAFSGEIEIWSAAAAAGIAPALVYVDRQQQAVICERAGNASHPITGGALGQLMCAIHSNRLSIAMISTKPFYCLSKIPITCVITISLSVTYWLKAISFSPSIGSTPLWAAAILTSPLRWLICHWLNNRYSRSASLGSHSLSSY